MSVVIECLLSAISKDLYEGPLSYCTSNCDSQKEHSLRIGVDQSEKVFIIIDKPNFPFLNKEPLKNGLVEDTIKDVVFSLMQAVIDGKINDPDMFTAANDKGNRFLVTKDVPVKTFHEVEFLRSLTRLNSVPQEVKDKLHVAIKHFLNG